MKRCEELFLAIGGLESARLAKTEETPRSVKRPKPRLVLIAAVIALAALLVGCAVAVYIVFALILTKQRRWYPYSKWMKLFCGRLLKSML